MNSVPLLRRLWIYQKERFPLLSHSLLVLALTIGVSGFASAGEGWPSLARLCSAFAVALGFFMLLRISDEFKDAEEDATYRPYRPVPRGLVTLRELAVIAVAIMLLQFAITLLLGGALWPYLIAVWVVMFLMSQEFFVAEWLRARPVIYMLTHMLVLPMIDFYLLAAAWPGHGAPPIAFAWFLLATYTNGIVFEIGRKVRAPGDEEVGVETYSALWGVKRATQRWLLAVVFAGCAGILAGWSLGLPRLGGAIALVLIMAFCGAVWVAWKMVQDATTKHSVWVERFSGVWLLLFYLTMGLLPHFIA